MSSYLYTWNPGNWTWHDLPDAVWRVANNLPYDLYWSCGNSKKIRGGDIFFLMRVGMHPKGIIGCGYVLSEPYPLPHWDPVKAREGRTSLRTDVLFKTLSEVPMLGLEELKARYPSVNWTPQVGGVSIPDEVGLEIFDEIQQSDEFGFAPTPAKSVAAYSEGRISVVTTRNYDRSAVARQRCIEHHGFDCSVCGFNFQLAYGDAGDGYVEVHHLRPLADMAEEHVVDPVNDLRPVCANCHRILHRRRPPYSIEELKARHLACSRQQR